VEQSKVKLHNLIAITTAAVINKNFVLNKNKLNKILSNNKYRPSIVIATIAAIIDRLDI
jgi:hypothetical protein